MQANQNSFIRMILVVIVTFIITVMLGEFYSFVIDYFRLAPWKSVVLAHAIVAIVMYIFSESISSSLRLSGTSYLAWLPAITVLLGSFMLAFSSERGGPAYAVSGASDYLYVVATLTVIPLFEEILFRGGATPLLMKFAGPIWSVWFSALVFSVAHTQPTFERLMNLKAGFLLGPFILAICCDMIVRRWGKLWPAIAFHSACNATVYIFSVWNPAWLSRLSGLYM